jgi:capsular exopolysaccharide synthesis family protein
MNKIGKALQQAQRDRATAAAKPAAVAGVDAHLVSLLEPMSFAAEQYRTLRHVVEQAHRLEKIAVLAVSAAAIGDGKTTTAINLAGALAQAPDRRVLLIDADLRRPSVGGRLALEAGARGLVDAIADPSVALADVVQAAAAFNLSVLSAGRPTGQPYELLTSPRLGQLIEEARAQYDYVVVDTPPLVPVPDCRVIATHVDAFLLVVTAHKTPAKLFDEAVRILHAAKVLGVVFNGSEAGEAGDDYARYARGPRDEAASRLRPWYPGERHFPRLRRTRSTR